MTTDRNPSDDQRAARSAARRQRMTIERCGLQDQDEPLVGGTVSERFALVEEFSRECWLLSGRPMPTLPRSEWTIRVLHLQDDHDQD